MCTYVSTTSLFPPYELMSAAGEARRHGIADIALIDCIAEKWNSERLFKHIEESKPNIILSLIGVDSFENDILSINEQKKRFPETIQIVFGHFPSIFSEEILEKSLVDIVIQGEPDVIISDIINAIKNKQPLNDISSIAFRDEENDIQINSLKKRILDLNQLALPSHDLINGKKYFEPLMPTPFGMIQTSRGCPFRCNFCVTTYGKKYTVKSPERIIEELKWMIDLHNIKSFRIIDDTFTIQKNRVLEVCELMIQEKINLKWSCLSRTDTLTKEMLEKMRLAGCQRIYFGLESGNQEILNYYKKDISLKSTLEVLNWCQEIGIDTGGLFMTGLPHETEEMFQDTVNYALNLPLTFISIDKITPYPGTDLYNLLNDQIEFSLFPYYLKFKDKNLTQISIERSTKLHRVFYNRWTSVSKLLKIALNNPSTISPLLKKLYIARKYKKPLSQITMINN